MASYLHYQIWIQNREGTILERQVAAGVVPAGAGMSSPIAIPVLREPSAQERRMAALFKVFGADRVYVEVREPGTGNPASTSAHAASDAVPRQLFESADGMCLVPVPPGGLFGVVQAAALS